MVLRFASAVSFFIRALACLGLLIGTVGIASAATPQHEIEVSFDSNFGEIIIRDRVIVSGQSEYRFYLAPWLQLELVSMDGESVEPRRDDQIHIIDLANENAHTLEFEISGRVPARGQQEQGSADAASSFGADGSFIPAYDAWIPHDYSAPVSYRLEVDVPDSQRAVATARLISESIDAGRYRARFEQSQPGEAPSLFIGPYTVEEQVRNGIRLRTYFHLGLDRSISQDYFDSADAYLQRYREQIGDYPYGDFHIVSAPLPVGLGFPGLTYIDRRIVPLPFMRTRSLAHEVLHNWWGNAVAVDYATGNWSEGLTTYMADYALARDQGRAAARTMRVKWLRDYAALPESRDRPIREFRSKQHQAAQVIGYNKLAFVFHMLSLEIGEPAFNDGIRRFWQAHRFQRAAWQDLQQAFEQAADRDLDWFFRQWLDRSGAPRVSLAGHEVEPVEEGFLTRVEVLQPVSGYRLLMPVELHTESGIERRYMTVDSSRTQLEWVTPEKPVAIHFDPDNDVFRRLTVEETPPILRDVTLNPRTQTLVVGSGSAFVDSARELASRLLDTEPVLLEAGQMPEARRPLLLITTQTDLDEQLTRLKFEPPAALPESSHGAVAWTSRFADGTPVLVVATRSDAELGALLRPLPHYGGQSYAFFDAGRVQNRGVWQLERGPLYRDLRSD